MYIYCFFGTSSSRGFKWQCHGKSGSYETIWRGVRLNPKRALRKFCRFFSKPSFNYYAFLIVNLFFNIKPFTGLLESVAFSVLKMCGLGSYKSTAAYGYYVELAVRTQELAVYCGTSTTVVWQSAYYCVSVWQDIKTVSWRQLIKVYMKNRFTSTEQKV